MLDNRLYWVLKFFTNLLYLNFLWLLACLPVLTIPAATTAMFGVLREWVRGNERSIMRAFISLFQENLRQSSWVGFVWILLGAILVADFFLVGQMGPLRYPLYMVLFVIILLYAFASLYLFPVMVNYDTSWTNVLKNALLYSLGQPLTTLQCLLIVTLATLITVSLPVTLLITGSLTAYCVYFLCERTFRRVQSVKNSGTREATVTRNKGEDDR